MGKGCPKCFAWKDLISPFLQAAKEGNVKKLEAGLDAGVPGNVVDEHGVSALMMAAFMGSTPACEVLLKKGAEVNHQERHGKRSALMFASQGGHLDVVKTLLTNKADTSLTDSEMQTALHWAAVGCEERTGQYGGAGGREDATQGDSGRPDVGAGRPITMISDALRDLPARQQRPWPS
eukprot:s1944_g3.t1